LAALLLVVFAALVGFAAMVAAILRLTQPPYNLGWALPAIGLVLVLGALALAWAGRGVRRLSRPLGDLLEAADRVADGDYSARVTVQGPRQVRSVAQAFNTMASRLQASDEQRRGLLSDVTHELRTPLTVIQGNVEGMLDGIYAPDEAHLRLVLEQTQLLSRLVDDLRTLALTESGALVLKRQPTDLPNLIHETAAAFGSQSDAAGVDLVVEAPPDMPPISLDPERMRQVLLNLLTNAARYTPPGGRITVRCGQVASLGDRSASIEVEDTGPGIAPEDLPHVFDRFYKSRDSGGMGLGLAIAKSLVEAHRGTIAASSSVGHGTTIRVILPVEG
jgi:signal transduction histidine kinase